MKRPKKECNALLGHRFVVEDRLHAKCTVCGKLVHCSELDIRTWARMTGVKIHTVYIPEVSK